MLVFCGCSPIYFSISDEVIRPFFSVITCKTSSANSFFSRTLTSSSFDDFLKIDDFRFGSTMVTLDLRGATGDESLVDDLRMAPL